MKSAQIIATLDNTFDVGVIDNGELSNLQNELNIQYALIVAHSFNPHTIELIVGEDCYELYQRQKMTDEEIAKGIARLANKMQNKLGAEA